MARVLLVLANPDEARDRASGLRGAGHTVVTFVEGGSRELSVHRERPPDAAVLDLHRQPSLAMAVAGQLRRWTDTREVPLVFAGGDEAVAARARRLIPDAQYVSWQGIRGGLQRALDAPPPEDPAVPDAMAGYSGTPLPKKLGIREGQTVALLGAPRDFETTLGALPDGVTLRRRAGGAPDITLLFATRQADLRRRFPAAEKAAPDKGRIWIVWPKQASGVDTDLTGNVVRAFGLQRNWVDFKICAVDETWSGLCFSRRA